MVDFHNEATVGVPAVDVERISILQRRYDCIEAFEDYKKKRNHGADWPLDIVKARLFSLFIELQACLKRRITEKKEYEELYRFCINARNEAEVIKAIFIINEQLDEMRLIRVDSNRVYDYKDTELENEIKGF